MGTCALSCPVGFVECGGSCIDPLTSPTHCGASGDCTGLSAGVACPAGNVCSMGTCALSCPVEFVECGSSYISPGGTDLGGSHGDNVDFTIAFPNTTSAYSIYYTTDGSTPVPGQGTTIKGTNPVTITGMGNATLRWYADYGAAGREPATHVYTHSVDTGSARDNRGDIVQHVSFNGSNSPVIVVAPGALVSGTARAQYWKADASGYCPTCIVEFTLGLDPLGNVFCDYSWDPYPGTTKTVSFSFNAPMTPGLYPLRASGGSLAYSCAQAAYPGGQEVGDVIVKSLSSRRDHPYARALEPEHAAHAL